MRPQSTLNIMYSFSTPSLKIPKENQDDVLFDTTSIVSTFSHTYLKHSAVLNGRSHKIFSYLCNSPYVIATFLSKCFQKYTIQQHPSLAAQWKVKTTEKVLF
jgi:hypothetical protein